MFDRELSDRFLAWKSSLLQGMTSQSPHLAPSQYTTPATVVVGVHAPWIGSHLPRYMRCGSFDPSAVPHKGVDVWQPKRVASTTVHAFTRTQNVSIFGNCNFWPIGFFNIIVLQCFLTSRARFSLVITFLTQFAQWTIVILLASQPFWPQAINRFKPQLYWS